MSEATCINLLERFGTDYRVTFDPAYDSRHVPRRCLDPWLMQRHKRRGLSCPDTRPPGTTPGFFLRSAHPGFAHFVDKLRPPSALARSTRPN
jgi:hypothetical protein